jgi:ribosomal protein L34
VNSVVQLNRLIERLCDAGVDFVIVGGFAGMLHGSSLVTRDLDVCAVLSAENIAKLRAALGDLHPTHRLTPQRLSFLARLSTSHRRWVLRKRRARSRGQSDRDHCVKSLIG